MSVAEHSLPAYPVRAVSPWWSGLLSLLFWLSLLTAAALYAGVALAPKFVVWQAWERQYQAQQSELVTLEARSTQLEQVVAALNNDPQFAAEIVRIEFDAQAPGEEVIPMNGRLAYDPRIPESAVAQPIAARPRPWDPYVLALATQPPLRRGLLATAAGLVIVGFTFLHDQRSARSRSLWQSLRDRYSSC